MFGAREKFVAGWKIERGVPAVLYVARGGWLKRSERVWRWRRLKVGKTRKNDAR